MAQDGRLGSADRATHERSPQAVSAVPVGIADAEPLCGNCRFFASGVRDRWQTKWIKKHWWSNGHYERVPAGTVEWAQCWRFPATEAVEPDWWCGEHSPAQAVPEGCAP